MKKSILFGLLVLFLTVSCSSDNDSGIDDGKSKAKDEVSMFEKSYVQQYLSDDDNKITLIGYQTVLLKGEEKTKFEELYKTHKEEIDSERGVYIAKDHSYYRIYFPLHTAIVKINNKELTANENGIITSMAKAKLDPSGSLGIVGRIKSDKVTGCDHNIITDTEILLKNEIVPEKNMGNIYVFNMGNMDCCSVEKSVRSITPCIKNHGRYANCSDAFGIWGSYCVTKRDVCMDYNGFGSDCIKGPKTYFLGSDCQRAMARGHCWNEYM